MFARPQTPNPGLILIVLVGIVVITPPQSAVNTVFANHPLLLMAVSSLYTLGKTLLAVIFFVTVLRLSVFSAAPARGGDH